MSGAAVINLSDNIVAKPTSRVFNKTARFFEETANAVASAFAPVATVRV